MTATDFPRRGLKVPEAAAALGVSDDSIYEWVRSGVLRGRKVNAQWVISAVDVDNFFDVPDDETPAVASLAARIRAHEERLSALEERLQRGEAS